MPNRAATTFDLIVIGGGAAGSPVANGAAEAGMTVALIEEDQLGGTCLNYGCDPMNLMVQAAQVLRSAQSADRFGVEAKGVTLDWPALRNRIASMIDSIRDGDGTASVRAKGIELFRDRARFVSESEMEVGGETLSAEQFVIATGAAVVPLEIPGIEEAGYFTHRDVFTLEELPESLVILGSGTNALEFAQSFVAFGIDVTVITSDDRLLLREDDDVVSELTAILDADGLNILVSATVTEVTRSYDGSVVLTVEGPDGEVSTIEADEILVATERLPRVDGLGLDAAGVHYSAKGVKVGSNLRTSVPHIYAIGDVTGIYPYTHIAAYQSRIVLHNILHPEALKKADYRVVPWKVFTEPELSRVGLTEAEARAGGFEVVTSTMEYRGMPRPMTLGEPEGLVKLVVDRKTMEILGGHVVGAHASEVIAQVALAMQHRLPVSAIAETMHVHPTMAEGVFWAAHNLVAD